MFYDHINIFKQEVDKKRLYKGVKEISSYHRIQASTGFRQAAHHALSMLQKRGIESRILEFEAKADVWYLEQKMFQEWDCRQAYLDLVLPEKKRIVDFSEEACSIIQKSYPCDYRNHPLDVVMIDNCKEDYLKTLDLKGKMIFIHEMPAPYVYSAIKNHGAVGIITDFMREVDVVRHRYEAFDTFNYTSFWWNHREDEPKTFGFVLSPRLGDELRALCTKMEAEHAKDPSKPKYPQVTPYIDSSLYDGKMEVVEAFLPGEIDEEILITAHLCHPNTSANDNASGVSASIETLTVLKSLTESGQLPPLKRGIRLILIPEFTGTHCYLSTMNDYSKFKAGINLDMVGGKQNGSYGPITITRAPITTPTIVNALSDLVLNEVKQQVPNFSEGEKASLVNSRIAPHSGGSDHTVLNDPTIDAPCVMVGQWPDKYYHTSSDTLECIDPLVLAFSTTFACGYVYTLATLSEEDATLIFNRLEAMMMDDLTKILNQAYLNQEPARDTYKKLVGYVQNYQKSALDVCRFGLCEKRANEEKNDLGKVGQMVIDRFVSMNPDALASTLEIRPHLEKKVKRTFVGPIRDLDDYKAKDKKYVPILEEFEKNYASHDLHLIQSLIPHFLDGHHTIREVQEKLFVETGKHQEEFITEFIHLLIELDLAKEV